LRGPRKVVGTFDIHTQLCHFWPGAIPRPGLGDWAKFRVFAARSWFDRKGVAARRADTRIPRVWHDSPSKVPPGTEISSTRGSSTSPMDLRTAAGSTTEFEIADAASFDSPKAETIFSASVWRAFA
jgi:hypothetical protein